jgi:hypothetical protein
MMLGNRPSSGYAGLDAHNVPVLQVIGFVRQPGSLKVVTY